MSRATENRSFSCAHCGERVRRLQNGSYRNHCPGCLWSVHVDNVPGDRAASCGGLMEPVRLVQPRGKGLAVVHVCTACGHQSRNRLAVDDPDQPDSWDAIARVQAAAERFGRMN
ncbi:MAG: RNHCP domain-containing protein [Microlunatus sp.]|nr:RNHCP domain-containing protein [Microlunatus sp.]